MTFAPGVDFDGAQLAFGTFRVTLARAIGDEADTWLSSGYVVDFNTGANNSLEITVDGGLYIALSNGGIVMPSGHAVMPGIHTTIDRSALQLIPPEHSLAEVDGSSPDAHHLGIALEDFHSNDAAKLRAAFQRLGSFSLQSLDNDPFHLWQLLAVLDRPEAPYAAVIVAMSSYYLGEVATVPGAPSALLLTENQLWGAYEVIDEDIFTDEVLTDVPRVIRAFALTNVIYDLLEAFSRGDDLTPAMIAVQNIAADNQFIMDYLEAARSASALPQQLGSDAALLQRLQAWAGDLI